MKNTQEKQHPKNKTARLEYLDTLIYICDAMLFNKLWFRISGSLRIESHGAWGGSLHPVGRF